MAEAHDKESRTEQATEKRLQEALDDGNVPVSREAANFAYLVAAFSGIAWLAGSGSAKFAEIFSVQLGNASAIRLENAADAIQLFAQLSQLAASAALPFVLLFTLAGIGAPLLQNRPSVVWKKILPERSRILPSSGFRRLFGTAGLIELAKSAVRLVIMALAVTIAFYLRRDDMLGMLAADPAGILDVSQGLVLEILLALAAMSFILLVLDLPAAYLLWQRSLRMSHAEIKEERKQIEGDAQFKSRRRAVARARARRRMVREVARATVVIANPTHFAVALRYVRQEGGAPRVLAKGQDHLALLIRKLAEERGIPVVEDKALARSLYKKVAVDQMIPIEFYKVIAEILIRLQARRTASGALRT